MSPTDWTVLGIVVVILGLWFWHHQHKLKHRARLMQEAIHNRDFTLRLPTNFLFSGERALMQTLNQLGEHVREQVNLGEVESWEKLTRVLTHEIMNATAPIASISQSMLHSPAIKESGLEEGILAIHNTVQHLNSFVDGYRKYSELQKPKPQQVDLIEVINEVQSLYQDLTWKNALPESAMIETDPNLLRLGYSSLSFVHILGMEILDFFDFLTNSLMMPIAAFATCIFVVKCVGIRNITDEVTLSSKFRFEGMYKVFIRSVAPIFVVVIFLSSIASVLGWLNI